VTTLLSGFSFENHSLAIPPMMQSRFTLECEPSRRSGQTLYAAGWGHHADPGLQPVLRAGALSRDGDRDDDRGRQALMARPHRSSRPANRVGDALGGTLDIRRSGSPATPRSDSRATTTTRRAARWCGATASDEMCIFLAFSDSVYQWGTGIPARRAAAQPRRDAERRDDLHRDHLPGPDDVADRLNRSCRAIDDARRIMKISSPAAGGQNRPRSDRRADRTWATRLTSTDLAPRPPSHAHAGGDWHRLDVTDAGRGTRPVSTSSAQSSSITSPRSCRQRGETGPAPGLRRQPDRHVGTCSRPRARRRSSA